MKTWTVVLLLLLCGPLLAQSPQLLKVSESAWTALDASERTTLSQKYIIDLVRGDSAGAIIDAQIVNESTPGTAAGSQIGAAYGSALYVDRAFRGNNWNYSATNNVTATLAGALIGSLADQRPQARFHTRYTIRTLDGQIRYQDEVKTDPFRQSVGVCVSLPMMSSIDQALCTQTAEHIRQQYLRVALSAPPPPAIVESAEVMKPPVESNAADTVKCKFGSSTPVIVERSVCYNARGEIR